MEESLAATVYLLWRERNCKVFQQKASPVNQVAQTTINSIRAFLRSTKGVKASMGSRSCVLVGEKSIIQT